MPRLRTAAVYVLGSVAGHRRDDVQRQVELVGQLSGLHGCDSSRCAAVDTDDDLVHIYPPLIYGATLTDATIGIGQMPSGQSDAPDSFMWPIRQLATTSATTQTITSRTTAPPPCGMPARIRRCGASSR